MAGPDDERCAEIERLHHTVASMAAQLADVAQRLDRLTGRSGANTAADPAVPGAVDPTDSQEPAAVGASAATEMVADPGAPAAADAPVPRVLEASHPVPAWPAATVAGQINAPGTPPVGAAETLVAPPPPFSAPFGAPATPKPPDFSEPPEPPPSWADRAGSKVLGWVGAGITLLGVVLLLVIASQRGIIGPSGRVAIGVMVGVLLLVGGSALHRTEHRRLLGTIVTATGLAVEYLAVIGAVRSAAIIPALVGQAALVLIVILALGIAIAWQERWIALCSFAAGGVLAPVVADGITSGVMVFEVLIVLGGAACVLADVGLSVWVGAAGAAAAVSLPASLSPSMTPFVAGTIIAMVVVTWALFLGRWLSGHAPTDPGEFPVRPRPSDPAQIARDYADYDAHMAERSRARRDRLCAVLSISIAAGLLVVALAALGTSGENAVGLHDLGAGITAAVCAVVFFAAAVVTGRQALVRATPAPLVAWLATIALAAVALLRLLTDDARSISWMVLAIVILLAVARERSTRLLVPALVAGAIAVIAAGPALGPDDLFRWRPHELLLPDGGGLAPEAWTAVLPAGGCVILLCAVAYGATARCRIETDSRPAAMAWALVVASAVACYGLLAVTMVCAYAVSPTRAGYQTGHIVVTALVMVVALALLWQGFRSLTVRLGGLGLAAVAVGKLLFFDTSSLESIARAMTVIGVGVLLLLGAVVYVGALGRADRDEARDRDEAGARDEAMPPTPGSSTPAPRDLSRR